MKAVRWLLSTWLFFGVGFAHAGLYNTAEMHEWKIGLDFQDDFQPTLIRLQSIPQARVDRENPTRRRYFLMGDLANRPPETLSVEEKLNLSDYLIRRGRVLEGKSLLLPLARNPATNFLVFANLATACHLLGEYQHAIDHQSELLRRWPKRLEELDQAERKFLDSIGWNEGPLDYYRKVETYYLKLLKQRAKEAIVRKDQPFQSVDPLFGDDKSPVRYGNPDGSFKVGYLAADEKSKLPRDALEIVQQLLVWLPHDTRLLWQLAEIYNSQASLEEIGILRKKLDEGKLSADDREKYSRQLNRMVRNLQAARSIFTELARGLRLEPILARREAFNDLDLREYFNPGFADGADNFDQRLTNAEKEKVTTVNWRTLGIGFGTGLLVGLFGLLQIQEWRRRRTRS